MMHKKVCKPYAYLQAMKKKNVQKFKKKKKKKKKK